MGVFCRIRKVHVSLNTSMNLESHMLDFDNENKNESYNKQVIWYLE